jgi:hypothetical protein
LTKTAFRPPARKRRSPARRSQPTRRKDFGWLEWWPVVVAIAITPFAVRFVYVLTLSGPWGPRFIMPWTFLLQGHSLHMQETWTDHLVEGVMYAQFPFYGLAAVLLHRQYRWSTTIAMILALHFVGFLALAAIDQS